MPNYGDVNDSFLLRNHPIHSMEQFGVVFVKWLLISWGKTRFK